MGANFNLMEYWPIILMFAVMYFLMIRPQQKRRKEQADMLAALAVGTEVITSAGILGKIASLEDNIVHLEVAANVVIKVQKASIVALLPSGTLDAPANLPPPSCCA
jgi:preprotein translocase subunit YajC